MRRSTTELTKLTATGIPNVIPFTKSEARKSNGLPE
jgi:hypothetical protein